MWVWWSLRASAETCDAYAPVESVTDVVSPLAEASGLAASRTRPGVFFTHGDNGDEPVIVAFDERGNLLDEHFVTDANNEDWEDIAAAPCPEEKDGDCLYIGDIGDNDATRAQITIYVIREPQAGDQNLRSTERWVAVYPDGPHDAEALLVHPCTGRVHVVTKESGGVATVYRLDLFPEDVAALEVVNEVDLSSGPTAESREVTGGDWDASGERVVLRTSDRLYEWVSDPDQPNEHWTLPPLEIVGSNEVQGEGVAYGLDGAIYTSGEGVPFPLSRYACESLQPATGECVFPHADPSCGCSARPSLGGMGAWLFAGLMARRARAPGRRGGSPRS